MTLVAPRSRQGRLMLVLAFLAATVAVVGTFMWASNTHAQVATAGTTVTVTDNTVGAVDVGSLVTYHVAIATTAACTGTCTNATFEMDADPNLWPTGFGSKTGAWSGATCTVPGGALFNAVKCTIAGAVNDGTIDINYVYIATNDYNSGDQNGLGTISNPSTCHVYDDGDTSSGGVDCTDVGINDTSVNDYVVTPATAENGPGQDHTIAFTLPVNFDCKSDILLVNQGTRSCVAGDVTITNSGGATATLVSANLSGTAMTGTGTETVVINSPTAGDVKVTLDLIYDAGIPYGVCGNAVDDHCDAIEQVDPVALKTYGIVGGLSDGAFLRHVDLPDIGTEDAADIGLDDTYCATVPPVSTGGVTTQGSQIFNGNCGVLSGQDDIDDAIGSFHGACIIGSLLTFATNAADITWSVEGVPGPGPVAASQSGFAGPQGEPCWMWGAGTPGTQQITAIYHKGLPDEFDFFWDYNPDLPLIKEWNTIDSTRIVSTSGDLGDSPADRIAGNTGGAADWTQRDCSTIPLVPTGGGDCTDANLDGLTLPVEASGLLNNSGNIRADGKTFIDYTMGHHNDIGAGEYSGPVDGAQQTYIVTGDCGSMRLEDPTDGDVNNLQPGDTQTVLSSDKGVAFEFVPNNDGAILTTASNSDCGPESQICVEIDTENEANQFTSTPRSVAFTETVCVSYHVGPPTNKTPILAWAGQRVVLENYWGDPTTGACASDETPAGPVDSSALGQHHSNDTDGNEFRFGVLYSIQSGSGSFTAALVGSPHDVDQAGHDAIVHVATQPFDDNGDGITDPQSNCTSRVIVESEDQTELDVIAYIVNDSDNLDNATPKSQQVAFVVYFMKFESEKLQLIPDGDTSTDTWDSGADPTTGPVTAAVSDNVAAVVQVKGYVETQNCPARDSRVGTGAGDGQLGEFFPANRCIFPDDWAFKAGAFSQMPQCTGGTAPLPQQCRPEFDIATDQEAYSSICPGSNIAGPFSMLDQITHAGLPVDCGDSLAPYPPADSGTSDGCLTGGLTYDCRDSNFPDGLVTAVDAPMPPALTQWDLNGSGYLWGISKSDGGVDTGFNSAAIPAEPWIARTDSDGEGYVWNTWGPGANNGLYDYWTDLASHGPEVISCAGPSSSEFVDPSNPGDNPCGSDPAPLAPCSSTPGIGVDCVLTGGYDMTEVYTDEHGFAMTLINGDANLDFSGCSDSAPVSGTHTPIVLLNGFYCPNGAAVGSSTLVAVVDYPDKRKHFAEVTNSDTINWTWNGTKDVTVEDDPADATGQYHYVVFHVTDRDGFCGESDSLHPVLGEEVDFRIDSTTGIILPDVNGNSAEGPASLVSGDAKSATTHTFDTNLNSSVVDGGITVDPVMVSGECQAWVHISESLLNQVDVIITAFDPEGTVTFDTKDINPTPVPTAPPTQAPTPTPFTLHLKWGDSDCDGSVAPRDGQAILLHFLDKTEASQTQPCPSMGETVMVNGNTQHWGDFDCSGAVAPRDGQAVLFNFLSKTAISQTSPCPAVGSAVDVQLITP